MVYFHGGDLTDGNADTNFGLFASFGDGVVVVDVSYRLSLAGFLSTKELQQESELGTSGMYGIRDMLEALRWVQRNIVNFGGDAKRVTIFGQSSGGTAVLALLASPLSHGLFSGAISLSGSPNISITAEWQRQQHSHIVEAAGCAGPDYKQVVACLRGESVLQGGKLWEAKPKGADHGPGTEESPSWDMANGFDVPRYADGLRMPGLAVVDGDVVREPAPEAYALGRNGNVSVLISTMAQEAGCSPGEVVSKLSSDQFKARLAEIFSFARPGFSEALVQTYKQEIERAPQLAFDTIGADTGVGCGNLVLARAAAEGVSRFGSGQAKVYHVLNEVPKDAKGYACHGHDLDLATGGSGPDAELLRAAWHEFAATGQIAAWSPVDLQEPWVTMLLKEGGVAEPAAGHNQQACDLWRSWGFGPEFWWSN